MIIAAFNQGVRSARQRERTLVLILKSIGFCAAMLLANAVPGHAQTVTAIRLAPTPADSSAEAYIAKDMGFFAAAGLDVNMEPPLTTGPSLDAVISNSVDISMAVVVSLALAHEKKIPLVAIAPGAIYQSSNPYTVLFVPSDSPVRNAKDLNGKTVAVAALAALTEYSVRAWIDQHGGDSSTVKILQLSFPAMTEALSAHRIDAALVSEPFLEAARKSGRILGYPYDTVSKEFLTTIWYTTTQWASAHPDLVKRFAAVMRETAIWANKRENQTRRAEIIVKYYAMLPETVKAMVPSAFAEKVTPALFQPQIDLVAKYGKVTPFPARDIIYSP